MTTKGKCMVRGKYAYNNYASPHLDSEAEAVLSYLETEITFAFGPRYAGSPPRSRG